MAVYALPYDKIEDQPFSRFSWRRFQRYGVELATSGAEEEEEELSFDSHPPPARCKSGTALKSAFKSAKGHASRCAPLVRTCTWALTEALKRWYSL